MEEPLQDYDFLGLKRLSDRLDLPILAMEWIGYLGGQPFNASAFIAQQACDILRQRAVGITGQMKLAHLAESFGALVHGGNHHVILAIRNDPSFEAYMGIRPRPAESDLDCRGTLVVENGAMSLHFRPAALASGDTRGQRKIVIKRIHLIVAQFTTLQRLQ